jgi:hypothetical protein
VTDSGDVHDVPSGGEADLELAREMAWLWTPPTEQPQPPPVLTRLPQLPVDGLTWENVERLFLRMLERLDGVQWAKLYGTRGQDHADLDACVHALQRVDPRTVVVDPFTGQAGPLWSAGVSLVRGS